MVRKTLKKWGIGLAMLLTFSLPVAAMGPDDVESLKSLWLIWNGKKSSYDALEVNGEIYVPLKWVEEEMEIESTMSGSSVLQLTDSDYSSDDSDQDTDSDDESEDPSDSTDILIPEEPEYHAGMVIQDLNTLLDFLDRLEDLSTEYKSVIYAHLNNISQGKSTTSVENQLRRLQEEYDYYSDRYEDMMDEIDNLASSSHYYSNKLLDDLEDDLDDIMDYKEEAFEYLLEWIDDKSDDDAYDDYESADRKANNRISTVQSYVKGTLSHMEYKIENLID